MRAIARELRSLPGAILGFILIAIVAFWVLNLLRNKTPAPISTLAGGLASRASNQYYQGSAVPAAPAMTTSPYSLNPNISRM